MNNLLPLGYGAWAFISVYLLSLLVIGWFAKKSRKEIGDREKNSTQQYGKEKNIKKIQN